MGEARTARASAKSQVEALFDSLALEYVRERERQLSFVSQKRIAVGMLLGSRGRLLEVGCGPGIMLPDLLAMGFDVHAIDISAEMVRRAEQRMSGHPLARRCHLGVGDVEEQPRQQQGGQRSDEEAAAKEDRLPWSSPTAIRTESTS